MKHSWYERHEDGMRKNLQNADVFFEADPKPCNICGGSKLHSFNCEKVKK